MQSILITGASGFVGSRLTRQLSGAYQLFTPGCRELNGYGKKEVMAFVREHRPDYIIHAGAISNTGYCQQHPEESFRTNVQGSEHFALAAAETGAKLLYFSSDQVYNGSTTQGPHTEDEALEPAFVYGGHKLEAEHRILAVCPSAVCLRAAWMYDLPVLGCKNNLGILGNLYRAALTGQPLGMNPEEWRGITWVWLPVRQMEQFMQLPGGVYNAGAEASDCGYETGKQLAKLLGLPERTVIPARLPGRNLAMSGAKLRSLGIGLGDTVTGFARCLAEYGID